MRPGITREAHAADAWIACGQLLQNRKRLDAGMVINHNPFPRHAKRRHGIDDARVKAPQGRGFVERGGDDRDHGCPEAALRTASITRS